MKRLQVVAVTYDLRHGGPKFDASITVDWGMDIGESTIDVGKHDPRDFDIAAIDELARQALRDMISRMAPRRRVVDAGRMGSRGGTARAASLSPERRREIAKKAAETRWHGPK